MMVLDDIYGLSWTWSSLIPVTLVQIMEGTSSKCKKKNDLQAFPNKENSKSETLDMVCAKGSY